MAYTSRIINKYLHSILLRYQDIQFVRKNNRVRASHPEVFKMKSEFDISGHQGLWSPVINNRKVNPSWFVMHSNISGISDVRYVPENIYFPYIEPIFNDLEYASSIADKNRLHEFVPTNNMPLVVLRYLRGEFFSESFEFMDDAQVDTLLKGEDELVIKPSTDSSGGCGVRHWIRARDGKIDASELRKYGNVNLVVQRCVEQHPQSARFNSCSVNTCRIMTLRCPWSGEVVLLKSMLRIGGGKSICDHMMLGGLCLGVQDDGLLTRFAYDYDGKRYSEHPVTGLKFSEQRLDLFPKMVELALKVARKVPYMNILSFDIVADRCDNPICLEINTAGQGITQLQYDGIPLFRQYTDNVIEYCVRHQSLNTFRHFRTFYW